MRWNGMIKQRIDIEGEFCMDIIQALKEELQIGRNQVEAAVKLIDGETRSVHRARATAKGRRPVP